VIPRLSEAAADLRTLPADSFRSLSAERRTDVEQMAQVIVSLVTLLRSPNDLTQFGMLGERAATVIRLLDSLLSYFPTPGGPGTVPLIKVRCPIPGCTQSGYKRSHDQPAPTCPIHNRPMT
jgi:hypothetical protein